MTRNDSRTELGIMAAVGVAVCCGLPLLLGAATLAATGLLVGSLSTVAVGGVLIVLAARRIADARRDSCCDTGANVTIESPRAARHAARGRAPSRSSSSTTGSPDQEPPTNPGRFGAGGRDG